jgi:hypothetical protein
MVADVAIYAMRQIQMDKFDRNLKRETDYWNGKSFAMMSSINSDNR